MYRKCTEALMDTSSHQPIQNDKKKYISYCIETVLTPCYRVTESVYYLVKHEVAMGTQQASIQTKITSSTEMVLCENGKLKD